MSQFPSTPVFRAFVNGTTIGQPGADHLAAAVVYLVLDELAASSGDGRALEVLEVSWLPLGEDGGDYEVVSRRAWNATLTGKAFPKLRELLLGSEATGNLDALSDLWTSPLVKRLERVQLATQSYRPQASFALAASQCSTKLTVELDLGPFIVGARPGGALEVRAEASHRPPDETWTQIVAALDPALWKKVTVAAGALTEPQLAALRKRLPKATVVSA
jgi:hypothetical protein